MKRERTFQQIYDFCLLDNTYNAYYNVPDCFKIKTKKERDYFYKAFTIHGQCRAGTFLYHQACKQLERFLNNQKQDFYFHVNEDFEIVDYQVYEGKTIYIIAHVKNNGVRIEFTHPYKHRFEDDRVYFTARSHRRFDKQGLIDEVRYYIDEKLLLSPGRYRDLQMEHKVPKEKFVEWYKNYQRRLKQQYEQEYWDMIEAYSPDNTISWEESYSLLQISGIFFDIGITDELEKENLADEFMQMCNRI